jgi:hypothetical protein
MIIATTIKVLRLLPLLLVFSITWFFCSGCDSSRKHVFNIEKKLVNSPDSIMTPIGFDKSNSDYNGIPLSKLIGISELIVYGSVKKVLDSTILLHIIRKVSGNENESDIEILKARPDAFAGIKPAPYETGQCYLLFLINSKNTSSKLIWKAMGVGEEAQMPVIDNYIYFNDRYFEGIPLQQYKVNGVELNIQRFEFPLFLNAVEEYKTCYQWVKQGQDDRYLPQKKCSDNQVSLYAKKSFMHNYLVNETRAFIPNR